jgi:hypothetical protein
VQARVSELSRKIECVERAESQDLEADEGAIDAMVEQFRVENDLISAEETEAWLDKRGITADELQDHFTRGYWREALDGKDVEGGADDPGLSPDLFGKLEVELFISGAFTPLSVGLSRRLVARASAQSRADSGQRSTELGRFLDRTGLVAGDVPEWLRSLDRSQDWLDGMLEMEASYRAMCDAVLTPERLSRALASLRLPLTRLELETVEFDSIDAAREGRLCVRDDELSLEQVARESRFPFKRLEVWADELPEEQRQKLLCAGIGDVQDPAFYDGVFHLSRLTGKTEPTLENSTVRNRVEQKILDSYFSDAGAAEISWFLR